MDSGAGSHIFENKGSISSGFMVKLDSNGNFVWGSTVASETGYNWVREVAPDGTSGLIAAGVFSGTAHFESPFGSFDLASRGDRDGFVARLQFPAETENPVTVRVEDGRGGFDEQSFVINVSERPPVPQVDLTIASVQTSGLSVAPQTLAAVGTVSATVRNPGADPVTQPFDVLFFEDLNHNADYDAGTDTALGKTTVTSPLAANGGMEVSANVASQLSFPGASFGRLLIAAKR